ncbi:MAG: LLM class flavin-dependent oxidoreductase [Propionibacteriales bacterium]|nr:LLM class flavin-dependent oxidoreductase [Propionibacteriales bacterium]
MGRLDIGLGLLTTQTPPGGDPAAVYEAVPAIGAAAERARFDAVWSSEHHVAEDGYLTAPLLALAAIAGVTSTIRLCSGVVLAPLWPPLRLAEEAVTLQLMSKGRLTLGLGLGYRTAEYGVHGVPRSKRGRRLEETVEVVRRLWAGETVDLDDERGRVPGLAVSPHPSTPIPVWLGGYAEPAVRRAARIGDGFLAGGGEPELVGRLLDQLDDEGPVHPGFQIGVQQTIIPEDGPVDPEVLRQGLLHSEETYAQWRDEEGGGTTLRALSGEPDAGGTVAKIVDRLTPVLSRLRRYEHVQLVCRLIHPGLDEAQSVALVEDAGERLLPALRARWEKLPEGPSESSR